MSLWTFILSLVAMVFGFIYLMKHQHEEKKNGCYQPDEAELMQEMHKGLTRMEKRIETLETLLLERDRDLDRAAAFDRALAE